MKALFVAYQNTASRTWTPVARLTHDGKSYHFAYTHGAKRLPNFVPFGRMNALDVEYVSGQIFPLFANFMASIQNASDDTALLLQTNDPATSVGYVPCYYSADFSRLLALVGAEMLKVTVDKVNLSVPIQYRVLCKLSVPWLAEFQPC